jgi:hypothetical protein
MRARVIVFVAISVLLVLSAAPAYGQEIPPLPHAFYGAVKINNNPAPVGTRVEARGEGVRTGIEGNPVTTVAAGVYGSPDPMGPKLVVQGNILEGTTVTFYVNGVKTAQTAAWHSGEVTELNITATIQAGGGGGGGGGGKDTTPPTIKNVKVSNITKTSADISWDTDEMSDSQVEYWASPSQLSPLDKTKVIDHRVHLAELTPGSNNYFKVMSRDDAGNLAVSDQHTFNTLSGVAVFTSSKLSVSPGEVYIGEPVTIVVLVVNTGDGAGSYEVMLKINGVLETTQDVTINAGASKEITFTTAKNVAGSYTVGVDGLEGSFTVKEKPALPQPPTPTQPPTVPATEVPTPAPAVNWPLIWGIIGAAVVVGIILFVLTRGRAQS